jgi:hypothetical protein
MLDISQCFYCESKYVYVKTLSITYFTDFFFNVKLVSYKTFEWKQKLILYTFCGILKYTNNLHGSSHNCIITDHQPCLLCMKGGSRFTVAIIKLTSLVFRLDCIQGSTGSTGNNQHYLPSSAQIPAQLSLGYSNVLHLQLYSIIRTWGRWRVSVEKPWNVFYKLTNH